MTLADRHTTYTMDNLENVIQWKLWEIPSNTQRVLFESQTWFLFQLHNRRICKWWYASFIGAAKLSCNTNRIQYDKIHNKHTIWNEQTPKHKCVMANQLLWKCHTQIFPQVEQQRHGMLSTGIGIHARVFEFLCTLYTLSKISF